MFRLFRKLVKMCQQYSYREIYLAGDADLYYEIALAPGSKEERKKEFNCTPWKERKKKAWSNFEPFGLRALFRPGGSTASNSFKRSTRLGLCFSLGLSLASVLLHLQ